MGTPSQINRPKMQMPNGRMGMSHAGPPPGGQMHSVLPVFTDMTTLATISIVIELVFVALAIYVLVLKNRKLTNE